MKIRQSCAACLFLAGLLLTTGCPPQSNTGGDQNSTGDTGSTDTGGDTQNGNNSGGDTGGNTGGDTGGNTVPVNSPLPGGILGVKADATGKKDGTSWVDAFTDLQDALAAARVPGSNIQQIWVAKGAYKPAGAGGDPVEQFKLINDLTLYGGFAGTETKLSDRDVAANATILSGDLNGDDGPSGANRSENSQIIVSAQTVIATAIIDGFTITGATTRGLFSIQASPIIRNCTFIDNRSAGNGAAAVIGIQGKVLMSKCIFRGNQASGYGGAVYSGASIDFTDCVFENNGALYGGAAVHSGGTITMMRCSFTNNSALRGGAILDDSDSLTLKNCNFMKNSSTGDSSGVDTRGGGAILCDSFSSAKDILTAYNCIFQENVAGSFGGAIHSGTGAYITLAGCLFDRNEAAEGGAIHASDSVQMQGCTLSRNSSRGSAGGIFLDTANWNVYNSILWGNTADSGLPKKRQLFLTVTPTNSDQLENSDVQDFPLSYGVNNIGDDPLFVDAANANYHLQPTSPAIGKGSIFSLVTGYTTDLDGNPRLQGMPPLVDMGAYEQ